MYETVSLRGILKINFEIKSYGRNGLDLCCFRRVVYITIHFIDLSPPL